MLFPHSSRFNLKFCSSPMSSLFCYSRRMHSFTSTKFLNDCPKRSPLCSSCLFSKFYFFRIVFGHFTKSSINSFPVLVSCLPDFLPLIFSRNPADSACCSIVLIILPPPLLNSSGLEPLSFLPPYLVLSLFTPTTPLK